jgi:hypothetical protein
VRIDSRVGELDRIKQLMGSDFKGECIPDIGMGIWEDESEFSRDDVLMSTTLREGSDE